MVTTTCTVACCVEFSVNAFKVNTMISIMQSFESSPSSKIDEHFIFFTVKHTIVSVFRLKHNIVNVSHTH